MIKHVVMSLMLVSAAATAAGAQGNFKNGQDLTGSWRIEVDIPAGSSACPPGGPSCTFLALATAISDGTIMQTAALPGVSTGHGVWRRTGLRQFTVHTTYFRLADTGFPIGTAETVSVITIDKNGTAASGTYANRIFDLAGNELVGQAFQADVTATRITP